MHLTFLARVTYAIDLLSTFTSTQLANSKLTQQTPLSKAKQALGFTAFNAGSVAEDRKAGRAEQN